MCAKEQQRQQARESESQILFDAQAIIEFAAWWKLPPAIFSRIMQAQEALHAAVEHLSKADQVAAFSLATMRATRALEGEMDSERRPAPEQEP